jgi:hypothetical protein
VDMQEQASARIARHREIVEERTAAGKGVE